MCQSRWLRSLAVRLATGLRLCALLSEIPQGIRHITQQRIQAQDATALGHDERGIPHNVHIAVAVFVHQILLRQVQRHGTAILHELRADRGIPKDNQHHGALRRLVNHERDVEPGVIRDLQQLGDRRVDRLLDLDAHQAIVQGAELPRHLVHNVIPKVEHSRVVAIKQVAGRVVLQVDRAVRGLPHQNLLREIHAHRAAPANQRRVKRSPTE